MLLTLCLEPTRAQETLEIPLLDHNVELTADIVSDYAKANKIGAAELSELINSVYKAITSAGTEKATNVDVKAPAVPIKKSVFPDYLICLEDGKKLKMLKRHLMNVYNLTPVEYRAKWGLHKNYPMVCENYAKRRSMLAIENGLGRAPAEVAAAPVQGELIIEQPVAFMDRRSKKSLAV